MTDNKCDTCQYCGMDMDMDPYCSHPEVLKRMPYGQTLCSLDAPTRKGKECGPDRKLWKIRETRTKEKA